MRQPIGTGTRLALHTRHRRPRFSLRVFSLSSVSCVIFISLQSCTASVVLYIHIFALDAVAVEVPHTHNLRARLISPWQRPVDVLQTAKRHVDPPPCQNIPGTTDSMIAMSILSRVPAACRPHTPRGSPILRRPTPYSLIKCMSTDSPCIVYIPICM